MILESASALDDLGDGEKDEAMEGRGKGNVMDLPTCRLPEIPTCQAAHPKLRNGK